MRSAIVLLLGLMLVLSACKKEVPAEEADQILQELASEVVKMENPSGDEQLAKLRELCEKHSVEFDAIARYIKDNPEAEKKLHKYMDERFEGRFEQRRKELKNQVAAIEDEAGKEVEDLKDAMAQKKEKLELDFDKQIAKLKSDFKKEKQTLIDEIKDYETKVDKIKKQADQAEKKLAESKKEEAKPAK